jgi:hypothetical protein
MARDIGQRLSSLKERRSGTDRLTRLSEAGRVAVLSKSLSEEGWQKRAPTQPYTRYALGAMEEVDEDYTRISLETADRVGKQLHSALSSQGHSIAFRLQGSVPLNVHIRGVSDVDLLTIEQYDFLTYHMGGRKSQLGHYHPTTRTSLETLSTLRKASENALVSAYPAATVDTSGSKAIKISGGSLARPVDVVPSHWHDTLEYQETGNEHDRGITILDASVPRTLQNLPFLHIKRITERCGTVAGSLRKAIRLCKNVKADAEKEGAVIPLSSFDIAAVMYYASLDALRSGAVFELVILSETQRHLDYLYTHQEQARTLMVPDGSRAIFDGAEKFVGLYRLSLEMDDLLREVAKEQNQTLRALGSPTLADSRQALASTYVF